MEATTIILGGAAMLMTACALMGDGQAVSDAFNALRDALRARKARKGAK